MADRKIVVFLNPKSGKERGGSIAEELGKMFADSGSAADIRLLQKEDDIPARVKDAIREIESIPGIDAPKPQYTSVSIYRPCLTIFSQAVYRHLCSQLGVQ